MADAERYRTTFGRAVFVSDVLTPRDPETEPDETGCWQLAFVNAIEAEDGVLMCWTWERVPRKPPATPPRAFP